ncbi:MAG TPA: hypothetical protein VJC08_01980 [bacterium]|nr:hypothetical protein [bacterium]
MVDMGKNFTRLESQIKHVIDTLRDEQRNPPELQAATNRLLVDAERLDDCLNGDDLGDFRKLLAEMKQDAWKARTFAALRPDLSEKTQRNLEYVLYSIEALYRQSCLN